MKKCQKTADRRGLTHTVDFGFCRATRRIPEKLQTTEVFQKTAVHYTVNDVRCFTHREQENHTGYITK